MLSRQKGYTLWNAIFYPLPNSLTIGKYLPIFSNISEQKWLEKPVFNNVNRLHHSSSMKTTVRNKIKHFR